MNNLKTWIRIENESKLVMSLSVPEGKIVSGRARCVNPDSTETVFDDAMLQSRDAKKKLVAPGSYAVRLNLVFSDACTVKFEAHIVKPGGARHGDAYIFEARGKSGSVKRATIICIMK